MSEIARRRALLSGLALGAALAAGRAAAQSYPTRPVRLVVPYPAGGGTDIIGRVTAEGLSEALGQQVFVDNRPGAGGSVGAAQAARAEPDGYTLMMAALTSHAINMSLQPHPGFDLRTSFSPIAMVGTMGLALVVNPAVPAKTVAELVALAKAEPGKLSFASAGAGSPQHLAGEIFAAMSGIKLVHVPYRGAGPAMTDVLGGHVPIFFDTIPATLPHIKADKLRVLAVTTPTPSEFLPGVPTLASLGFAGYEVGAKFAVLAPAGAPAPVIARVGEEVGKLLKSARMIEAMKAQGISITPGGPAETARIIEQEIAFWQKAIKESGAKLDEK